MYLRSGLVTTALSFGLAAGTACAQGQNWDSVVDAAKREGRVVVYTATISSQCELTRNRAFKDKYGIQVDFLTGRGSEIEERVRVEQSSGRFLGDLYSVGGPSTYLKQAEGALQEHGDLPNLKLIQARYRSNGVVQPYQVMLYTILANKNLPADAVPRRWPDLLSDRFKGRIIADELRVPGAGLVTFQPLYEKYGDDFMTRLAAQNLVFSRDIGVNIRRVAQGEFDLFFPMNSSYYTRVQGLPIRIVLPEDGAPYNIVPVAVMKNAPHPNAARLLMNEYISPESQLHCSAEGTRPVIEGIADKLNRFGASLMATKDLGTLDHGAAQIDGWVRKAKQFFH